MSQPKLTPEAQRDIAEAAAWYRDRSARAADDFLRAITITFARLAKNPTANPVIDPPTGARRALLKRWHAEELRKTEADFAAGKIEVLDWDDAKKELRKRFE